MESHECKAPYYCTCYQLGDEPNEDCPIHGGMGFQQRCIICGRFMMKYKMTEAELDVDYLPSGGYIV